MTGRALKVFFAISIIAVASRHTNAQSLCDRVSEIRILPFKGERVDDAAYDALIEAGESALPCLIAKVSDTAKMRDPRRAPTYSDTRVGDVAYFVLTDIARIDFIGMLPARIRKKYKTEGVYAYLEFVERLQNRKWLQRRLSEWHRRKGSEVACQGAA